MTTRSSLHGAMASRPLQWRDPKPDKPFSSAKILPLLKAGVAAAPERADLRRQLVRALFRTGAMAEIVDRGRPVLAEAEADADFLYYLGRAALATQDNHLAVAALQRAAAKGFAAAFGYLAEALQRLDRPDEALEAALQRLQTLPADFASIKVVARVLLKRGEAERLWNLCVDLRARGAWGSWFSTVMASAAATLGIEDEFRTLVDRPRWFSATQLPVAADFNQRLAAELLALRSSTGAGMRIDGLESVAGPMAQKLLAKIRHAVEAYVAERQIFADDPMIAHRPASVGLYSWVITIHDHQHHGWHIHQAGWISGVYYVEMPAVESGDDGHPGAIEFGPYPFGDDEETLSSQRWHATPEPGLLVLFPSYYAHRTRPTRVADLRVCVPFDVRPSEAPAEED
jgi:tetratricopeptide (TPR) repeat protein